MLNKTKQNLEARLNQMSTRIDANNTHIELQRVTIRDAVNERRRQFDHVVGELKRLEKLLPNGTIGISHVDASNIKIDHDIHEVVQAIADLLRLGSVPEQGSEIVVISPE